MNYKVYENFSKKYKVIKYNDRYYLVNKLKHINSINFNTIAASKKMTGPKFVITDYSLLWLVFVLIITIIIINIEGVKVLLLSLIIHEFMHILIAAIAGVKEVKFGLTIKYNLFPILYISCQTMYEKSKYQRVIYYSAGVIFHFLVLVYCLIFYRVDSALFKINFSLLVINVLPFLFTDGYNIIKELFEVYNMRKIIMSNFLKPLRIYRVSKFFFLYYCFVIICFSLLIYKIVMVLK